MEVQTKNTVQIDLETTGDKAVIPFARKANLLCVSLLSQDSTATAAVVKVDKRVLAGSDTGRVELAEIKLPASDQQGKKTYKELDGVAVDCGDELVIEVSTGAGAAKLVTAIVEFQDEPETNANLDDAVATA